MWCKNRMEPSPCRLKFRALTPCRHGSSKGRRGKHASGWISWASTCVMPWLLCICISNINILSSKPSSGAKGLGMGWWWENAAARDLSRWYDFRALNCADPQRQQPAFCPPCSVHRGKDPWHFPGAGDFVSRGLEVCAENTMQDHATTLMYRSPTVPLSFLPQQNEQFLKFVLFAAVSTCIFFWFALLALKYHVWLRRRLER